MQYDDQKILDAPTCVRRYTGSTAVTAALLILFGYFQFTSDFDTSGESTSIIIATQIFINTLRLGGLLMAAIAICVSIGFPLALLGDAIVTSAIGALLVVSCVLFITSDGFALEYMICGFCGLSLLASGYRCWRDYDSLPAETYVDSIDDVDLYGEGDGEFVGEKNSSEQHNQSSKSHRQPGNQPIDEPVHFDKPASSKYKTKSSRFELDDTISLDDLTPDDTPPDGFLADFGKKK